MLFKYSQLKYLTYRQQNSLGKEATAANVANNSGSQGSDSFL